MRGVPAIRRDRAPDATTTAAVGAAGVLAGLGLAWLLMWRGVLKVRLDELEVDELEVDELEVEELKVDRVVVKELVIERQSENAGDADGEADED